MIRVSIFEDSPKIREVLEMLVGGNQNLLLAGSFDDATNIIDKIKKSKPDVILMDIKMPEISGVEAVKILKKEFPDIPILMQTVFDDDDKVFAAICAGATGYILKGTPSQKIIEAIIEVHEGGSPMTPSIARKVLRLFQGNFKESSTDFFDLSEREKEILGLLVKGQSYKMIADSVFLSYHTVNAHVKNIYRKLHVNSVSEAVNKAINQKIISVIVACLAFI